MNHQTTANNEDKVIINNNRFLNTTEGAELEIPTNNSATDICNKLETDTHSQILLHPTHNTNPKRQFPEIESDNEVYEDTHKKKLPRIDNENNIDCTSDCTSDKKYTNSELLKENLQMLQKLDKEHSTELSKLSISDQVQTYSKKSKKIVKSYKVCTLSRITNKESVEKFDMDSLSEFLKEVPPVNRYTLRELGLQKILQNSKLRHEIMFETKLEFRPNSLGNISRYKKEKTIQFWEKVEKELKEPTYIPCKKERGDIANHNVEVYRAYMQSTAVAFEISGFVGLVQKKAIDLDETKEWWTRSHRKYKETNRSVFPIFLNGIIDILFDSDKKLPEILYLDESRFNIFRREAQRIKILGCVMLGTKQHFSLKTNAKMIKGKSPSLFFKQIEDFLLSFLTQNNYANPVGLQTSNINFICTLSRITNKESVEKFDMDSLSEFLKEVPPVNRYTLRELGLQKILQNSKLRHEIMFETKLEFRPNSLGNISRYKKEKTIQFWEKVEKELKEPTYIPCKKERGVLRVSNGTKRIIALIFEIKNILIELSDDSDSFANIPKKLNSEINEDTIFKLVMAKLFNPIEFTECIIDVLLKVSKNTMRERIDCIRADILSRNYKNAYKECFNILEQIKIDIANHNVEVYRAYMQSTAVAFEISGFVGLVQKKAIDLDETKEWWTRSHRKYKETNRSVFPIFLNGIIDILFDSDKKLPEILYLDESRFNIFRREAQRIKILGCVMLGTKQHFSLKTNAKMIKGKSPSLFFKQIEDFLLSFLTQNNYANPVGLQTSNINFSNVFLGIVKLLEDKGDFLESKLEECSNLKSYLLKLAGKESPFSILLQERIKSLILLSIQDEDKQVDEMVGKYGLTAFKTPIEVLCCRLSVVLKHHWDVYSSCFYNIER
ncbi:hypothetical protein BB558_001779 [Smittium angustum]|uniref:Uncharacterized protein n=2 Tax=Harpellales TaxID=61421 RepID=A0A2U1JAP0_SMIAN|nr:hypothetical protein BB558_001779 [Smittium angustum]